MRRLLFYMALLAACLQAVSQAASIYDPATLAAELHRLQYSLQSGSQTPLPPVWEVQTAERRYSISTVPLRTLVEKGENQRAREWLENLSRQLESYEAGSHPPSNQLRSRLNAILRQPEFAAARPPGPLELLRRRIIAWLQEWIRRIFGVMAGHPTASQFLFWILAAGCLGFLAFWLIRWWTADRAIPVLPHSDPGPDSIRSVEEWLAVAHQAAGESEYERAIHAVYWAAVGRLQRCSLLPRDLTRTPREYLRLLAAPPARDPAAALTASLERFWYARRAASPEDFHRSLEYLEALPCKAE